MLANRRESQAGWQSGSHSRENTDEPRREVQDRKEKMEDITQKNGRKHDGENAIGATLNKTWRVLLFL